MLDLIGSGLVSFWLDLAGVRAQPLEALETLALHSSPTLVIAPAPDPASLMAIQQYLQALETRGLERANQGIWMQSGPMLLANNSGTVPLPAASLTKIATSLAALKTWGPNRHFETLVSATGPIANGVLQGDLVIRGGGDPFFVWEEAIALGNSLNALGIDRVTGNLVITGNFVMNYKSDLPIAGELLKQALDSATWGAEVKVQHSKLPPGTAKPRVAISGSVQLAALPNPKQILLLRHYSLPLSQILKEMNVYSNNEMAEILGQSLGGAQVVQQLAASAAGVSESEIQLINSSGLGVDNRISPRAVCAMFMVLQRELLRYQMDVADLFPVSGLDHRGTLEPRQVPAGAVVKTGTLNEVSALAGVLPTRDRGLVWFTIINRGWQIERLRGDQDRLLQRLLSLWKLAPIAPTAITPHSTPTTTPRLGASDRNEILYKT
jgi:D-alanyl-D-alanine carboxypeptidase/D-alanyl-D-alanine-endopeptidase (penicillin-binding protein 4)